MSRCHAHPLSIHIPSVIIPCFSTQMLFLCIRHQKGRGWLPNLKEYQQSPWKRGGAGETRQHPTYIGCTTSDTKRRTNSSRLYPYFTATPLAPPHRTCTPAKGIPISFAIAPAVPQKNRTPAKSTTSPPAEDLSQLQRRPIRADWNPIPFIPSLKDNAFNVVRDYVHIFPSWEDYCEDKHHFHIFLSNLRVSAIIHGYYFPVFCWSNTSMIYITLF